MIRHTITVIVIRHLTEMSLHAAHVKYALFPTSVMAQPHIIMRLIKLHISNNRRGSLPCVCNHIVVDHTASETVAEIRDQSSISWSTVKTVSKTLLLNNTAKRYFDRNLPASTQ